MVPVNTNIHNMKGQSGVNNMLKRVIDRAQIQVRDLPDYVVQCKFLHGDDERD